MVEQPTVVEPDPLGIRRALASTVGNGHSRQADPPEELGVGIKG